MNDISAKSSYNETEYNHIPIDITADDEISVREKLFAIVIAILPFTLQYASPIPLISLGEFLLIPFIGVYLYDEAVNRRKEHVEYCGLLPYFLISVITSFLAIALPWFNIADFFTMFLRLLFYAILIYIAVPRLNIEFTLNAMSILAVVFSIYLIIQWLSATTIGQYLPTYINKDFIFSAELDEIRINLERYYLYTFRASSLFLEPSYFSFFVCVPLAYQLLYASKKKLVKSLIYSGVITLAIVLSASSSGLFIGAIPWILFAFRAVKRGPRGEIRISPAFILLIILLSGALLFLLTSPLAIQLMQRTQDGASMGPRILRPLTIMQQMEFPEQIIGVGINNLQNYVLYRGIFTPFDETGGLGFVSLLFSSYIYSGIIGFIAFITYLVRILIRSETLFGKAVCLQFIILSVYSGIQFSARFAFLCIVILSLIYMTKHNKPFDRSLRRS